MVRGKQAVPILRDNHASRTTESCALEHKDYPAMNKGVIAITNDKQAGGVIFKPFTWIIRLPGLLVIIVQKNVSRLNRLGSYEIDEKAMEAGHNHHHNSRIQNMTH